MAASGLYIRKASGITRDITWLDALIVNIAFMNIGTAAAEIYSWGPGVYPGADVRVTTAIDMAFLLFVGIVYSFLSSSMPRAGGDYIFGSRIIHPIYGFVTNFMIVFGFIYITAWLANMFSTVGLSSMFGVIGRITNNPMLMQYGLMALDPTFAFFVGSVVLVFTTIIMVLGSKVTVRAIWITSIVGTIGFLVNLAVLATTPTSVFQSAFNGFMSDVPDAYNTVIRTAIGLGMPDIKQPLPFGSGTFLAMPLIWVPFIGYTASAYWSGEVVGARKTMPYSILGSLLIVGTLYIIGGIIIYNCIGYEFNMANGWLWYFHPDAKVFPLPPWYLAITGVMLSPALNWLTGIAYVSWCFNILPSIMMCTTRSMFAWSFDRVIPTKFADVSRRFHTPTVAIVLAFIIGEIFLVLFSYYSPFLLAFNVALIIAIPTAMVSFVAIVYPYLRKDLFETSPSFVKTKIAGIPFISIAGLIGTIFSGYMVIVQFSVSIGLMNEIAIGLFIIAIAIWFTAYTYWKRKGIDITLMCKEIPPE